MIKLHKLNDEKVEPIKIKEEKVHGGELFPINYFQCFIVAKKKSGKSQLIFKILQKTSTKHTNIILFSSTAFKDPLWAAVRKYFKKKDIPMVCHTSIVDDNGGDQISQLVSMLQKEAEPEPKEKKAGHQSGLLPIWPLNEDSDSEDESESEKKEESKTDYTIIFDDLSGQSKNSKSLQALARSNRHWHCRGIISSQHLCDIPPGVRQNMDFWITFKGQPVDKLKQIWQESDVGIPFDLFERMYQEAVRPAFGFFYINCRTDEFRSGFSHKFLI